MAPAISDAPYIGFPDLANVVRYLENLEDNDPLHGGKKVMRELHGSGALRLPIPVEYGGLGLDWAAANNAIAVIAQADASAAIILFLHYAVVSRIMAWGTAEQKGRLLGAVSYQGEIFASAWSEPGSGATKVKISTSATRRDDGSWVVTGGKTFTTGVGIARFYLVLAQVEVSGVVSGSYGSTNQCLFIVDAYKPGMDVAGVLDLAGMRRSLTGLIRLRDCVLSQDDVLAGPDQTPEIISHPHGLGLTLGAVALGVAEAAYQTALKFALQRQLLDHQVQRHRIFDMAARLEAARALVTAAGRHDGDRTRVALMAKVFTADSAEDICRDAQRLIGSTAFARDHPLNRLADDARAVGLMGPPNYLCKELVTSSLQAQKDVMNEPLPGR